MGLLDNKVALITGGASGFGQAGANLFVSEGAKVAVADLNPVTGKATVEAIKAAGGEAIFIESDVSKMSEMERMVKLTADTFGRLDAFWHNAGNVGPGTIEETEEGAYDLTMSIHLKAGFFGSKFAAEEMKKIGGGSILYTSSMAGWRSSRASPVYGIAKAGLVALAKNLAVGYGQHNIRVNAICPGASETPLWPALTNRGSDVYDLEKSESIKKMYLEKIPMRRFGDPMEMAKAALFFCSDLSSYVTGESLPVAGGLGAI